MSRPESPRFTGRWKLSESDNFDPFLQDCNVGFLQRQAVKVLNSEHHILQEGDRMKVNVLALGQKGKQQEYAVGGSFTETEINGDEAEVSTAWDGENIVECHKCQSFEYKLTRSLDDEETMVLHLESPKGLKARRIYKKIQED